MALKSPGGLQKIFFFKLSRVFPKIKSKSNEGRGFCQNLCVTTHFRTFGSDLRSIDQGGGGGGGQSIHFWKCLFTANPKFSKSEP